MSELIGKRIDIFELVDPIIAHRGYGYNWVPLSHFIKGKQTPKVFYGKEGYCTWNMTIGISDYDFKRAYKKVGTMVITSLKKQNG